MDARSSSAPLGKIRGLQQLANRRGIMALLALDQRASLREALNPQAPSLVRDETLIQIKLLLLQALAPLVSAVVLDPVYGAGPALAQGALPGDVGLVISLEAPGYLGSPGARRTALLPNWDVARCKQMGASAASLSVYYRADVATASEQQALVAETAASCRSHDLPLLLEPRSYALGASAEALAIWRREHPYLVHDAALHLLPLGADLLVTELPADLDRETGEEVLDHCRRLTDALNIPWVLRSTATDYERYRLQVEIACLSGASGFLAGMVIWQELMRLPAKEWERFVSTVAYERLQTLAAVANEEGRPARPTLILPEGWHETYGREAETIPAALAD